MKRETWSIVFACALGALIGTFAALEIADRFQYGSYFWGIGALFGGMIAYVAVDFRHFCTGVVDVYHATIAWRPNRLYWRAWFAVWLGVWSMTATAFTFIGAMIIGGSFLDHSVKPATFDDVLSMAYYGYALCWPGVSLTFGLLIAFGSVSRNYHIKTDAEYEDKLRRARDDGYGMVLNLNPFGIIFWMFYHFIWAVVCSPRLIAKAATIVVAIAVVLAQFVAKAFVHIHSSRRTLCFIDAALGAGIGYTFGSALIGTVAGVILGVINYELVTVRWLKLAPK